MLLTEAEVQRSRTRVAAAFPRFTDWEHTNAPEEDHEGFSVWGRYTPAVGVSSPTSYFVTFDSYKGAWKGHLTVGKHCYYWSSADAGDAYLLNTEACATLDEAMASLIGQISSLFAALTGSKA